jgi:hypothetical protein
MACFRCDSCGALSIRSVWSGDIIEPALSPEGIAAILTAESPMPLADTRWYPAEIHGKRYPDVPTQIAAAASEAHRCIATAKHKGITTGSLMHKINEMHQRRLIRDDVRDGAHEVRYLGNDMAHGDYAEPVPQEDAELVATLMDEILEEIYQAPARVARRRAARLAKDPRDRDAGQPARGTA